MNTGTWRQDYVRLPAVAQKRLILVPKFTVRRKMALNSQEFYSKHILNFIQEEEMQRGTALVRVLKGGGHRPPTKKSLKERFPFSKDFLARFSEANLDVLSQYKKLYADLEGANGSLQHEDFDEHFDEAVFAKALALVLRAIPPGNADADRYHSFVIGALEFIFWPNLIYPRKEFPLHDGRKRIDITYTNAAQSGFFWRVHTAHNIASSLIMVECKNYSKDPANPEIDQLAGRFGTNRGRLGIMLYRTVDNYDLMCFRCRDTAQDNRGFMLPLGDEQVIEYLDLIAMDRRADIDARRQEILLRLIN